MLKDTKWDEKDRGEKGGEGWEAGGRNRGRKKEIFKEQSKELQRRNF